MSAQTVRLLLFAAHPYVLLFLGGMIGALSLYAVHKAWALYRLLYAQHDREAALLREVRAAADRLQVSDHA